MAKKNLAIIGNGMAAAKLLDDLIARGAASRYSISIYSDEVGACYNRILLSKVLAGADPDAIRMKPADWEPTGDVHFIQHTMITKIDHSARTLHATDGRTYHFDLAVMATGSKPFVPKIDGLHTSENKPKAGVFVYRTLDDCLQIRSKSRPSDNAIVLGGGLLGLECAKALRDAGLHVTIIHLTPTLMDTQLDELGGKMLQRQVEQQGLFIRCGVTIQSIIGEQQVESVLLSDGSKLSADLVVLSCGIRPRIELAQSSGIPINRGVLVNDMLATHIPGVYAIGECAEHRGKVYGIVPPIWEQCEALADILCGTNPTRRYVGSKLFSRLKVAGVEVASMGVTQPSLDSDEVIQVIEDRKSSYCKLIIRENKLIGAHFVGNTDAAAQVVQLFDKSELLPRNRMEILCSPSIATGVSADIQVCNCNCIKKSTIQSAIQNGCDTVEAVCAETRAGTGCGSCRNIIATMIEQYVQIG